MRKKVKLPLYVSWRQLKDVIGWAYSRAHTDRLEHLERDPFPSHGKIGSHRNSHPIWYTPAVLDYFERHGLPVNPEDIEFS